VRASLWASPPAILAICRFPDAPISPTPHPDASDLRCGGEESELRVSLVGVSCVGTTTIGRILADRRGWPFFDLDDEIERHFGISIERLQARFLTSYDYRKDCAVVLEERIEEIMDRVQKAGDNHVERVAALEEYLTLTRAHEGETWFDAGASTEDLADSYLALGRADDASTRSATRPAVATPRALRCRAS